VFLTGSRLDIRWLSGRGVTTTLCVLPVFSVSVMEKCCDGCGDGEYIHCRVVLRRRMSVFEWLRWLLTGNRWDIRWLSGRGKTPTLCVFSVISVAFMEGVVTLAVTENTSLG
jgi:hypothetical protein